MFSGPTRIAGALVTAISVLTGAAILPGATAAADPSQDDQFLTLLGYEDIPAIDNATSLIDTAHKVCGKLDDGMTAGDLVELIRNNGFNENPLARFYPQRRVTKTIDQFINAAVQAYCPYDQGKIASITARSATASSEPTLRVAAYTRNRAAPSLVFGIATFPSGEVPPSNPPPIPAEPPPVPHEVAPAPPQSPPPPHRVQPVPQQVPPQQAGPAPQQAGPAPQEAEPPPQAEPPAAAPPPDNGGGAPANPSPEPAPPAQPAPPGHVRLAP
ncbi:MAG TPA: DUF732 domain-containing protein [Mycobacterium sp.]|nr:DUF732 domain-containing protein [Mycobacterium sp.]